MSETVATSKESRSAQQEHELDRRLNAASGGLLLIWLGIVLFTHAGGGLVCVGAGVVIVGEQLARMYLAIKFDKFWIGAGCLILAGGVVVLSGLGSSLVPVLLIVIGASLLGSTVRWRGRDE